MSVWFLLTQPFAQHALLAAALVAVTCGLIAPLVVIRGMSFAVHGTAELAFTGAAAGLLIANNPVAGALAGSLVVAVLVLLFFSVLALPVFGGAPLVGSLLVLILLFFPAAAAQRLSASPLVVTALSVVFAVVAADGGLLASFGAVNIKASVFITTISFAIYLAACLAGPLLRDRRQRHRQIRQVQPAGGGPRS